MGAPTGCSPKGRKPVRAAAEACPKAGHLEEMRYSKTANGVI